MAAQADLRRGDVREWLKVAQEKGQNETSREGKTVWRGETHRSVEGFAAPLRIVFEVTERTTKDGQYLLVPEDVFVLRSLQSLGRSMEKSLSGVYDPRYAGGWVKGDLLSLSAGILQKEGEVRLKNAFSRRI